MTAPTVRYGAFDSELSIQAASATTWRLLTPLVWTGTGGDTFSVPIGFVTDFATIPRFLRWLVQPYGAYTRAAVLHDWLLVQLAEWTATHPLGGQETWDTTRPPATSRDADGIFRRVMQDLGVWGPQRWTMWAAVRMASLFNHNRAYGRDFGKDALRVLGVGLLAGPFAAIGAIPVLFVLSLIRVLRAVTGSKPVM